MPFNSDDEFLAELKQTFSDEAAEHLASLNRDLLALERSSSDTERQQLLKEIFRNAHSLKGGAAVVGLARVERVAHHLESIFSAVQKRGGLIEGDTLDLVYEAVDLIGRLLDAGEHDEADRQEELAGLLSKLNSLAAPDWTGIGHDLESREGSEKEVAQQPSIVTAIEMDPSERPTAGADTVRIAVSKLDDLMTELGELLVTSSETRRTSAEVSEIADALEGKLKAQATDQLPGGDSFRSMTPGDKDIHDLVQRLHGLHTQMRADARRMSQVTGRLHEGLRRTRMLPISSILNAFPRMVRDLAHEQGKMIDLQVSGDDTELDRSVLQEIKAPLTHLIRNCLDHGLETPAERSAIGKRPEGTIAISASQSGDTVRIEVSDDGRGIDVEGLTASAVGKGLMSPEDAVRMERREALSLVFQSGFSTSPIITNVSGRGVGLDVVSQKVEGMNGTIEIDTAVGRGTTFSMTIPLTVATTRCVLVSLGAQIYGLPAANTVRSIRVSPEEVREAEGRRVVITPEGSLPLRDLATILGVGSEQWDQEFHSAVIVRSAEHTVGLLVDEIIGVDEMVVKALPQPFRHVQYVGGATLLGTGEIVVVLNVGELARGALKSADVQIPSGGRTSLTNGTGPVKIMLADDSITTRTLEKNILQAAGYQVQTAADGAAAWRAIQAEPPDVVVSDVEMPGMDGFELTEMIRRSESFKHLPVVLVTSLESEADRERGIEVGADAYIGKSSFDQEHLLDVIRRLI